MQFKEIRTWGAAVFFLVILFNLGEVQAQADYPEWFLNPPQTEIENGSIHFYGVSNGYSYEKALANSIASVAYQVDTRVDQFEKEKAEMTSLPYHKRSEAISLTLDSLEVLVSQKIHEEETYSGSESNYESRFSQFFRIEYENINDGYTLLKTEGEDAVNDSYSYQNRFTTVERNYGARSFNKYLRSSPKWEIVAHEEMEGEHFMLIKYIDDKAKYSAR